MIDDDKRLIYDALADTIKNIEKSINNIEATINNVRNSMLRLDNSKWTGQHKKVIDSNFMPYLKNLSSDYPTYLKERVKYLKNAAIMHQLLDYKLQSIIKKGE